MERRSFITCFLGAIAFNKSKPPTNQETEWIDAKENLPDEVFYGSPAPAENTKIWSREVLTIFRYEEDGVWWNGWKALYLCKNLNSDGALCWMDDTHFMAKRFPLESVTHWIEMSKWKDSEWKNKSS